MASKKGSKAPKPVDPWESLNEYVSYLKDTLGLREWRIDFAKEKSEVEGCYANTNIAENTFYAMIYLSDSWWDADVHMQIWTLIHEFLHCHTSRVRALSELVKEHIGASANSIFHRAVIDEEEQVCDAIALFLTDMVNQPRKPWRQITPK